VKCIVKDCENHSNEGEFNGDLCYPCHAFITNGEGVYSQVYRNTKREWVVEAAGEKIKQALSSYRMHGMEDEDGDGYQLVDCLSAPGQTILSGQHEIELLVDHILYYLIPPNTRRRTHDDHERPDGKPSLLIPRW
jgi:hypothetical protein